MKYKEIGLSWNSGELDLCSSIKRTVLSLTIECVGFDGSFDGDWVNCNGFPENKTCTNAKECCKHTPMRHSCFNISKLKGKYIIRRSIKWFLNVRRKGSKIQTFRSGYFLFPSCLKQLEHFRTFSTHILINFVKINRSSALHSVFQFFINTSRAIKWLACVTWRFWLLSNKGGRGQFADRNWNEKEAGDWSDKRRERDSLLSLTPLLLFSRFFFLFFALHPSLLTPGTDKIRGGRGGGCGHPYKRG